MTPLERLAAHVANAPRQWPETVLHKARLAFVDTVGCMIAGSSSEPAMHAATVASLVSPGDIASLSPGGARVSAAGYALIAGASAHALDYDDVFEPALSHASAVLVPAVLAASSLATVKGEDLLDAFVIGIDAQAFLAEAVNPSHYASGWHSTSTMGAPSAAVAVARLLRLDATRCASAISLAISMAAGSKRQFGTDAKPLHAGMAAQAGIIAALLARSGATASHEMLDGAWSFRDLYNGSDSPGFAGLSQDGDCALARYGLWAKPYPCCASTHRPIDALLELREAHRFSASDVVSIHATVSPVAAANLMYRTPETPAQARFSMNHCLAAALLDGTVNASRFEAATLADSELDRARRLVDMSADPSLSPEPGPSGRAEKAVVTVRLADGSAHSRTVADPTGHPRRPMSDADYLRKFEDCARGVVPQTRAEYMVASLLGLGAATFHLSTLGHGDLRPSPTLEEMT